MRSYTRTEFGSSQSGNEFRQIFSSHSKLNVPERVAVARSAVFHLRACIRPVASAGFCRSGQIRDKALYMRFVVHLTDLRLRWQALS